MSTEQLPPNSTVPTSGFYSCVLCLLSSDLAKEKGADPFVIAMAYAKENGVDPSIVSTVFKGCEEPIVRKRFNASQRFDECPIHKAATGWVLQDEDMTSSAAPERSTSKRKWWQFWRVEDSQRVATAAAPTKTTVEVELSHGVDTLGRDVTRMDLASDRYTCDTCDRRLGPKDGYLLTTKQVVGSSQSWARAFHKWQTVTPGVSREALLELAYLRASSQTPWVICASCSQMFSFDLNLAQTALSQYRETGYFDKDQAVCKVSFADDGGRTLIEPTDDEVWDLMHKAINAALSAQ